MSVDKCNVDFGNSDIVLVILEMSKIVQQNFDLKDNDGDCTKEGPQKQPGPIKVSAAQCSHDGFGNN